MHLTWEPATDENGVVGYQVSRDGTVIGPSTTGDYDDTGLQEQTTFSYTVAAVDAAGNVGPESEPDTVTTPAKPDLQPPSAPGSLTASDPTGNQVTLGWEASTDNVGVDHYVVQRNGSVLDTTPDTSHTDVSLVPGATYDYVVAAVDAAGNTGPTSSVRVERTTSAT